MVSKNIIPGSGIGSSGASAAGSVYAINKLLGDPFSNKELIKYAMGGEVISSISEHADNVAPALMGGLVMVKSINPQQIINLPLLPDLFCFIINPKIQVKTSYSREILPAKIDMNLVTSQVSNFGGLIHSLHTRDYDLLKSSLKDSIVEQHRKKLIPKSDEVKEKCEELAQFCKENYLDSSAVISGAANEEFDSQISEVDVVLASGAAGIQLVSEGQLKVATNLKVAADVNAVPPSGVAGLDAMQDCKELTASSSGAVGIGALAIGQVKYQAQSKLLKKMATSDKPVFLDFNDALELSLIHI